MMTREELKETLSSAVATIEFEKADGTLRKMRCTLMKESLPVLVEKEDGEKSTRKINLDVLPVWDIENGGWRSFRLDSIKSITVGV